MSDLVGNPEDRFSRVAAHFIVYFAVHAFTIMHLHSITLKTLLTNAFDLH